MIKDRKRLLIVDDDEGVRNSLSREFAVAQRFAFDVTAVLDMQELVTAGLDDTEFDISIVDLGFGPMEIEHLGFIFMAQIARSALTCAEMRIVYTGHPELHNAVRAMQLGATDFVSKAEIPPYKLVERVEGLLVERYGREERNRRVYEYLGSRRNELESKYPGRVVAIVIDENGPQIVADGRSRLDALLKYSEWRRSAPHDRWPVVPHLYIVPKEAIP